MLFCAKPLYLEDVSILKGALGTDHYWTDRIILLLECTLSFLLRAILEGVPAVGWVHGLRVSSITLREVMAVPMKFRAIRYPASIGG